MGNPFLSTITPAIKQQFDYAIDALIESCSRTCKLVFPRVKYIECLECIAPEHGKKGPNPYINGGRGIHTGACPTCNGSKKIAIPYEEDIELIVLFDYQEFKMIAKQVQYPEGSAATICDISLIEKLKDADYIILNTDISESGVHKFRRLGEPTPMGLGTDKYILTIWAKQ